MYISNSNEYIYKKEQDVSRKEKNVKSNARNTNSLFFQKYTSFSSKSKPKTHKNQNTKSGTGPTWHRADEATDRRF